MKSRTLIPATLGVAYVLFSALFVIGNYQNHAGDFGQYVVQARNILLGRPWDYLVEGLPSVPPAYPSLLALVTWMGGVNAYYYALLNSIMWASCAVLAFHFFHDKFRNIGTAYIFLVAVLFTPYILYFQQNGVPNIFYAASCMLALYAAKRLSENAVHIGYVLSILLPSLIRTEALALYAALFAYFCLRRQWKILYVPLLGVALLLVSDFLLSFHYELSSNFKIVTSIFKESASHADAGSGSFDVIRLMMSILYMFLSYVFGFSEFFATPSVLQSQRIWEIGLSDELVIRTGPLAIAITALAAIGFVTRQHYTSLDKLFFAAHLALLSAFLLIGGVPMRYLLPLIPIFLFYVIFTIEGASSLFRIKPSLVVVLTSLPIIVAFALSVPTFVTMAARGNSLFTPNMSAVADWVSQNRNGRPVGYYKERLMTLLLDIRSESAPQVLRFRGADEAETILRDGGLVVVRKISDYQQTSIMEHLRPKPDIAVVWEDSSHAVFIATEVARHRKNGLVE